MISSDNNFPSNPASVSHEFGNKDSSVLIQELQGRLHEANNKENRGKE